MGATNCVASRVREVEGKHWPPCHLVPQFQCTQDAPFPLYSNSGNFYLFSCRKFLLHATRVHVSSHFHSSLLASLSLPPLTRSSFIIFPQPPQAYNFVRELHGHKPHLSGLFDIPPL